MPAITLWTIQESNRKAVALIRSATLRDLILVRRKAFFRRPYHNGGFAIWFLLCISAVFCACTKNVKAVETPVIPSQRGTAVIKAKSVVDDVESPLNAQPNDPSIKLNDKEEGPQSTNRKGSRSDNVVSANEQHKAEGRNPESIQSTIHKPIAETILSVDIGPDPNQLGYDDSSPGWVIGPCSFAVDKDERIYIADPLKERIVVFHKGIKKREIPIEVSYKGEVDIRLLPNGDLFLYRDKCFSIMDSKGKERGCFGHGWPEIILQPDGVWARDHRKLVKIMDTHRKNVEDRQLELAEGTPSRDGKWLINLVYQPNTHLKFDLVVCERDSMFRDQNGNIPVCDRNSAPKSRVKELEFEQDLTTYHFGTDDQGRIHLATTHYSLVDGEEDVKGHLIAFSPNLNVLRNVEMSASVVSYSADNMSRAVDFDAHGNVYFLSYSDDNKRAFVTRYRWKDN